MKKSFFIFIAFIWVVACQQAPPPAKKPGEAVSGFEVYQAKCGLCHGNDGKLGISGAKDLSQSRLSLDERLLLIRKGKGSMPGFSSLLSEAEIEAVAKYVETLRQ